ncbi:hypothetical protein F4821DRAFT_277688 [Hypoxylon rubiginosum]|uniref:Uncharacterized protein n=1 Tax=Hypoxylon rubiginosum TaxID=110542 RepID=A0ACC0D3Y7_9PEZI|nr:hypothetical protein F4821DRAFT_277688 [Hypoxylon rubiginosum]
MAQPSCKNSPSFSQWWWELGAIFVGVTSIATIVIFLSQVGETALATWDYPIQPNTVISILTTIGKSSMMIPIASCLGQSKWARLRRPTKLKELQILDEASRGPWGSLVLLFNIESWGATIACCLGVVTILALAFEPTTQQILKFPIREARLQNSTAILGAINQTLRESDGITHGYVRMDAALLNGVLGSPRQGLFYCPTPATKCTWNTFTTLGLCTEFKSFNSNSDQIGVACWNTTFPENSNISQVGCNYTFPSNIYDSVKYPIRLTIDSISPPETAFQGMSWVSSDDSGTYVMRLAAGKANVSSSGIWSDAQLFLVTWRWCARTFHNSARTPLGLYLNYSITEEDLILAHERDIHDSAEDLIAVSTGLIYRADIELLYIIQERLHFTDDLMDSNFGMVISLDNMAVDIGDIASNIAEAVNGMITSHDIIQNPYLQYIEGTAYYEEVYIHVRWGWLVLPVLEMAITSVFLAITIWLSRDQPIFKSSILPYLAHGLEGWTSGELAIQTPESTERLEKVLFGQTAILYRGQDGQLKLRKCQEQPIEGNEGYSMSI